MIRPTADRLFDRFRRTGDPKLLARVFDLAAPELGRVASYLCRDRNDAEDAVQSAFTAALEHRDEWDGARPLLPWLLGLLANRVQQLRRAANRKPDPARMPAPTPTPSPPAVAAGREFEHAFQRALAEVPEPFATVLRHHLVDGEAPFEIAARLGVPAATVRTRLHRGLDHLRTRLPAGAALLATPLLLPSAALAAVRLRVLATLPDGSAVPATAASSAGLLAVVGTAAVLAVAVSMWWQAAHSDAPLLGAAGVSGGSSTALAAVEPRRATANNGAGSSSGNERSPAPIDGKTGTVHVLVRHAASTAPLVDVPVQVAAVEPATETGPNLAATELPAPQASAAGDPPRVAVIRTDAAGRGTLTLRAGKAEVVVLGHAAKLASIVVPADGAVDCTVDVPVSFTAAVRVVDADGKPVAAARILGERDGFGNSDDVAPVELGRSDADGRWRSARTEYKLAVWAAADDRADAAPAWLGDDRETELRLGGTAVPLAGRVLAADGQPLAGALLACVPEDHQVLQRVSLTRTGPDGSFTLRGRSSGRHHVLVQPPATGRGPVLAMATNVPAVGDRDWTIRLPSPAQLRVTVSRSSGAPLHASILATSADPELPRWLQYRLAQQSQTDGNGESLITNLMPGSWRIELSGGPGQQSVHTVALAAGAREQLRHTFAATTELVVEVVDKAGAPVPGLRVRIVEGGEQPRTDGSGRVRFAEIGTGAHDVVVTPATNALPIARQLVRTGAPARIVVPTPPTAARVRGRLRAPAGKSVADCALQLGQWQFDPRARPATAEVALDAATGAFVVEAVPAGCYGLTVLGAQGVVAVRGPIDVAAVNAEPGGPPTIDLGVVDVGPGSLRVRAKGSSQAGLLLAAAVAGSDLFEPANRGADADSPPTMDLPAGRWRALVWGQATQPAFVDVEVQPGALTEAVVTPQPGIATTLRLPAAANGVLTWTMPTGTVLRLFCLGERELVRGASKGHHRVELVRMSGEVFAAEFDVGDAVAPPIELSAAGPR